MRGDAAPSLSETGEEEETETESELIVNDSMMDNKTMRRSRTKKLMFVVKFCSSAKSLAGCENFSFCSSSRVNQQRGVYVFVDVFDCRIGLEKSDNQKRQQKHQQKIEGSHWRRVHASTR